LRRVGSRPPDRARVPRRLCLRPGVLALRRELHLLRADDGPDERARQRHRSADRGAWGRTPCDLPHLGGRRALSAPARWRARRGERLCDRCEATLDVTNVPPVETAHGRPGYPTSENHDSDGTAMLFRLIGRNPTGRMLGALALVGVLGSVLAGCGSAAPEREERRFA